MKKFKVLETLNQEESQRMLCHSLLVIGMIYNQLQEDVAKKSDDEKFDTVCKFILPLIDTFFKCNEYIKEINLFPKEYLQELYKYLDDIIKSKDFFALRCVCHDQVGKFSFEMPEKEWEIHHINYLNNDEE